VVELVSRLVGWQPWIRKSRVDRSSMRPVDGIGSRTRANSYRWIVVQSNATDLGPIICIRTEEAGLPEVSIELDIIDRSGRCVGHCHDEEDALNTLVPRLSEHLHVQAKFPLELRASS